MNDIEMSLHYLMLDHCYPLSAAEIHSGFPRKSKHTNYAVPFWMQVFANSSLKFLSEGGYVNSHSKD